jgi:predicted RNA-binding Zn ribbon-like protein
MHLQRLCAEAITDHTDPAMTPAKSHRIISGCIGLDFLNVFGAPGDQKPAEDDRERFFTWIEEAELATANVLATISQGTSSEGLDAVSAEARALAIWFRDFVDEFRGRPLPSSAAHRMQPLNRILQRDTLFRQIEARDDLDDRIAGSGLELSSKRSAPSGDILLLLVAQVLAEMICTVNFRDILVCEGPGCGYFFLEKVDGPAHRRCGRLDLPELPS